MPEVDEFGIPIKKAQVDEFGIPVKKKDVSGQATQLSYSPYVSPRPDAPKKGDLPLGVPNTQRSFNQELFNAKNAIGEAINNSDDILKRMIREERVNLFERQQQNIPGLDSFKNPAAASAKKFLLTQSEIKDDELLGKKQQAQQDDAVAREVIKRKKDPVLSRSAYLVDAQERVVNNPNKEADIISNADKIASGELTYNIKRGVLQQPQGALESAIRGFRERQKQLDDYEFMSQADDAKLLERLERDMATFDPDKPVPVPDGASAQFAEMFGMEGIPMLKSSGAAIATGLIPGAQGAAPFVAAAASSPEYYKRSYASALRDTYYQLRNRGKSPEEALKVARDQANKEGIAGAAEGAISSALGAKIGFKPTSMAPSTTNALNKVVMASKDFIVRNAPEAVTDAGAASLIQIANNIAAIDNGLDRNVLDGVQESAGSEFLFTVGVGTLTTGGRALVDPKTYRTILNGFARQPKDVVNAKIGEMVASGVITPEQATQVGKDLENERSLDAQIPSTVNDDIRPEITPRIEERNKLKQELASVNEAFHPQIKDKIKAIDQEILSYATNESAVQEGRTEGNLVQPARAQEGQQEIRQGTGAERQGQIPKTNVGDSNIGGQGQVAGPELSNIERLTPESIEVTSDATDFAKQMESAQSSLGRMGMSVSPYAQEDYDQIASEGGKFLRAAGNKVLSLLKPNGEMVSLVKDASVKAKGAAQAMISRMKDMGGLFMDNYDIYLTPIYEKAGYKVVARVPFNEQYAPEGWNAEDSPLKNKPDVVFMVRNDIAPEQAQTFTDYEEAQNYTQGLVDQAVNSGVAKTPVQLDRIGAMATELSDDLGSIDKAIEEVLPNAQKSLKNTGIKFKVVDGATDTDAARAARGNQGLFLSDDGTIIIDKSKLADEVEAGLVVWHEASHPAMNIIRNTNKPLYDAVVRGLNEAAKTNTGVADALNWAKTQPQYDNVDTQNDEAIVETIGRINSGMIDVAKLGTGLRQKLIDFVNSIAKFFGINPILDDTDIAAFKKTVSQVADALKTGRDIGEVVGQDNVGKFKSTAVQARSIAEMKDNQVEKLVSPGVKVSTRIPTAVGSPEDVHSSDQYIIDLKSQRESPVNYLNNALEIAGYPVITGVKKSDIAAIKRGLLPKSKGGNEVDQKKAMKIADEIYSKFVRSVADNLIWLHDQFDENLRLISRRWYDGANKIAQDFSQKFGVSVEQAAAVIASLSPQMDWYKNVSLAERVLDIVKNKRDFIFDDKMAAKYVSIAGNVQKGKNETKEEMLVRKAKLIEQAKKDVEMLKGNRIDAIPEFFPKALRAYDEVYNDKSYDILSPNADVIGKAKTKSGNNAKIGWQGYSTIAKAISIAEDGSTENISRQLGEMHKVRNFNNNIIDPNSDKGDITIDTHAVAAGLLKPLAGSDAEVISNLSGKSSAETGSTGTYAAFADAYRLAAKEKGILPRQMQSITWEAVRGLFTDRFKSDKANKKKINEIWDQYAQGKIDIDETRRQIDEAAGGVRTPSWARSGDQALIEDGTADNEGELSGASTMGDGTGTGRGDSSVGEADMVRQASEQASVGNRPEQSKDFKVAAFVMRKLGEGADKNEIAQGVASATGMSVADVNKIIADPEQYIRDSFPQLSKIAQDNLIERAKIQNIYRGHKFGMPINKAFVGTEVPRSKVVEYLNKTNKSDESFNESVKDFKNKWLDPAKGLPDWVLAIRDFSVGRKNIEIARALKTIERLKDEAKKIGFKDWDAFSKAMVAARDVKRVIPDEDGIALFDPYRASEGKMFTTPDDMLPAVIPDELKAIPEDLRPFAIQMRNQIDGLTKDLIGSGYVTPEQAVTLEKNLGQYVNRAYKMYNEKGFKPKPEQVIEATKFIADQKIKQILTELFPEGKPSTSNAVSDFKGNVIDPENINMEDLYNQAIEEAKKDVQAILDKKRNPYFNTKTDSRDTGILKERKDIPEPIRKLMGEYTDPGTVFVMTVAKQAALNAQSEYLRKMRDFGMGSIFFEKDDKNRPAEFSVEIASKGTDSKSPLGGLYTTPEIAEALEMADPSYNELTNAWMKIVGAVRWGKTVGSVATQAKNFESNVGFAVLNGMFLTGKNTKALGAAAKYVKGQYSKAEIDQITEKVIKLNLVGQSVGARELAEMFGSGDIHDVALDIAANPNNLFGKKVKKSVNVFSAANKLYRMGDDFWKVYAYINEREMVAKGRFKSNYESLTPEQQEKVDIESSERVKNTWPTYDRVVEGAKYVSKRAPIFGNFISFQAESLRVLANSIKLAREDMKDPEMKAAGVKRMVGIISYVGLRALITTTVAHAAGMAASGILGAALGDDEEEQKKRAIKKAIPVYARTSDIATIPSSEPHKYTVFSLSSLDPYGIIPNSLNALTEGREGIFSKEMQPGVPAAAAEFFSGFLEPEMTFSAMYSVLNNINPKTGRPIVLDSDTSSEIAKKVGSFVFGQLEPSTISMIERGIERGWAPELASFAGARPIDVDLHKSFGYVLTDMSKQMDAIKSEYNAVKYNDKYNEQEKAEAELEAERKKAFLISKVSETYRDFIKTGANPTILNEMINERSSIKTTGFDKTTKKAIKTGEVKSEKLFK